MTGMPSHLGSRRAQAWWEPTFKPALAGSLTACGWDFQNSTGPKKSFLSGEAIHAVAKDGEVIKFDNITFEDCDIQGVFQHKPSILFVNCRFHGCDFSYSEWRRVTFRECEFRSCSLALTSFEECEFRDCSWNLIGMQGSKTDFIRTFITNPTSLVGAGYSGRKEGAKRPFEHAFYQKFRLEGTKAHLARTLLYSHEEVGDDATYYESARLHDIQQIKAKIFKNLYTICFGKNLTSRFLGLSFIFNIAEVSLLSAIGFTNGWGSTILRPILMLIMSFALSALIYNYGFSAEIGNHFWQKSFDIATLAGYGNQINESQSLNLRVFEGAQLVVSILLYTVFFSTVVTRNSRSR